MNNSEVLFTEESTFSYWNGFYKNERIKGESTFSQLVKDKFSLEYMVLDIGCGSGRDSVYFAQRGFDVIGIDRSDEAIMHNNEWCRQIADSEPVNLSFQVVDVGDRADLDRFMKDVKKMAGQKEKPLLAYLRFFLHSINKTTETILLETLSNHLKERDCIAAEFRTIEDEKLNKVYDNHYRRFINAEEMQDDLVHKFGFQSVMFEKGRGFSIFNNEDPFLGRIIVMK